MTHLSRLTVALCAVAEHRGLSAELMTYQGKIAVVEGFAHELAHQLEAGRNFEIRIRTSCDPDANEHEASTLRIEIAALAALGVRVSLRRLWRESNWRSERPPLTKVRRTPSDRERRCVKAFVRIVEHAMAQTRSVET